MGRLNELSNSLCGLLLVLTCTARIVGKDNTSAVETDDFVTLKQSDGREFRAFEAGPVDALIWTRNRVARSSSPQLMIFQVPGRAARSILLRSKKIDVCLIVVIAQ
jgi:hypothetical protein